MAAWKWAGILGLTALAVTPFAVGEANDQVRHPNPQASKCSGPGEFALRPNPALAEPDIRDDPEDEPEFSETKGRTPKQARKALLGVCQNPRTGRTIPERKGIPAALRKLNLAEDTTGGEEINEGADDLPSDDPAALAGRSRSGPRKVIGSDQRVLQTPSTKFPFRAIARLRMTYQNDPNVPKKTFSCTGSFIGPFHVLTAGHCLFKHPSLANPGISSWADSVLVIPGFDSGAVSPNVTKPFGQQFVSKPLRSYKSWTQDGDTEGDIGLITLNQPFSVGSFGLLYLSDNSLDNTTSAQIIGYPGDRGNPAGTQQFGHPGGGAIHDYDSGVVEYEIDTNKGQSGGGVYRFWNNKRAIFAVHHGACGDRNCGARITKYRHDTIRGWQCKDGQPISGIC